MYSLKFVKSIEYKLFNTKNIVTRLLVCKKIVYLRYDI